MFSSELLQLLADRIVGAPLNGHVAGDFPEPLDRLWVILETANGQDPNVTLAAWAGGDAVQMDIARQIMLLLPKWYRADDKWQAYSLRDAFKLRPPLVYVIAEIVVVPSLVITYGNPGSLKSMLEADAMICVAAGHPWLVGDGLLAHGRAVTQTPCLWLDFDNGPRRTMERFEALARRRGITEDAPLYFYSMPAGGFNAGNIAHVDELLRRIDRFGARYVAIDNLGSVSGGADENSAQMIPVMAGLRRIVEDAGVSLKVIHHQRKGQNSGRAGESLRGHSSIEAALDLALLVEREDGSADITIRAAKERDADVATFAARWNYEHKEGTRELREAWFEGIPPPESIAIPSLQDGIKFALQQRSPQNQGELVKAVKAVLPTAGEKKIRAEVASMAGLGLIREGRGKDNASLYFI